MGDWALRRMATRAMRFALRRPPDRIVRPFILRAAMTALAPERALYEAGAVLVNTSGDRFGDAGNEPIPGRYTAGGSGQGGVSFTHYHHGHSLGWAMTSGRLAGHEAAYRLRMPDRLGVPGP
jgi:hypothetical protein